MKNIKVSLLLLSTVFVLHALPANAMFSDAFFRLAAFAKTKAVSVSSFFTGSANTTPVEKDAQQTVDQIMLDAAHATILKSTGPVCKLMYQDEKGIKKTGRELFKEKIAPSSKMLPAYTYGAYHYGILNYIKNNINTKTDWASLYFAVDTRVTLQTADKNRLGRSSSGLKIEGGDRTLFSIFGEPFVQIKMHGKLTDAPDAVKDLIDNSTTEIPEATNTRCKKVAHDRFSCKRTLSLDEYEAITHATLIENKKNRQTYRKLMFGDLFENEHLYTAAQSEQETIKRQEESRKNA